MFLRILMFICDFGLDVLAVSRLTTDEKDIEILLLRQQLRIIDRKQQRDPIIPRWQKVAVVVVVIRLKTKVTNAKAVLAESLRLIKLETVIGWHRELVRRKWAFKPAQLPGRPPVDQEIIMLRHGIPPLSERCKSSWQKFLNHYKEQFLACGFFTVETFTLQTLYVLFFIEHATRRVYFAGCTAQPTANWVNQQARHLTWELEARNPAIRYLIHDHDTKFPVSLDAIFTSASVEIIPTPFQAPNANAFAGRWVRTVREEC